MLLCNMQQVAAARVSTIMKRAAVALALAAIAGAIWYLQRPRSRAAPVADPLPEVARPKPITKVTKLANAEQRKQMAVRIADAQAARAAAAASASAAEAAVGGGAATRARPAPSLPADVVEAKDMRNPETLKVEIRAAMREVIPLISECYEAEMDNLPDKTSILAQLTLTGDPDIGTVVDANEVLDDQQKPLARRFDDCLRNTFQLIALPPLAEGDRVEVRYPFLFAKQ
jgi:hypothetical protein